MPPTLVTLPAEIIHLISDYLSLPARLAFKLISQQFYTVLPPLNPTKQDVTALSKCGKSAVWNYLRFDKDRRRCAVCKEWYPNRLFGNPVDWSTNNNRETEASEKILRDGFGPLGGPGMVDLPEGVCGWHRGRLCQIIAVPRKTASRSPGSSGLSCLFSAALSSASLTLLPTPSVNGAKPIEGLEPGWYTRLSLLCLHCGVVCYDATQPASLGELRGSCFRCGGCETCGLRAVRTYVRAVEEGREGKSGEGSDKESGNSGGNGIGRFVIWRRDGQVWVREWKTRDVCQTYMDRQVKFID